MDINWQAIEAISTFAAAVLAGWAVWQTRRIFDKQQSLSKELHDRQLKLDQRQHFVTVFAEFQKISTINPQKPVWLDVIAAVNFLDLLGVCWEAELVERSVLLRAFRPIFLDTYERIQKCVNPPGNVHKDGPAMLRDSRAATALYNHLMKEYADQDRPSPLYKEEQ